jgi:hypothetical protein
VGNQVRDVTEAEKSRINKEIAEHMNDFSIRFQEREAKAFEDASTTRVD